MNVMRVATQLALVAELLLAGLQAGCRGPGPVVPATHAAAERPHVARREAPLPRPRFVVCARGDAPAQPLTHSEVVWWSPREFSKRQDYTDREDIELARGDREVMVMPTHDVADPERLVQLAIRHLEQFEQYVARACAREFGTYGPVPTAAQLRGDWERASEHLHAAMQQSAAAVRLGERLQPDDRGDAACTVVVAAARLDRPDEGLAARAALAADRPCTRWALTWLAHAFDSRGRLAEARGLFEQALALDPGDPAFDATCTVAPSTPVNDRPIRALLDPYRRHCSWVRQIRYRLAWLDLRSGSASREATIATLAAIAASLTPDVDSGAANLLTAISEDIVRLGGVAPPHAQSNRTAR